jgi:hypothetical protein
MNLVNAGSFFFVTLVIVVAAALPAAQTPRPFPLPNQPQPRPAAPAGVPPVEDPADPATGAVPIEPAVFSQPPTGVPTEATLGVPLYPTAQFITSYDAGRGQRFYLFGANLPYQDLVMYYRTALKQRGSELFASPGTYQFDLARFREDTMAFPPSVTVKDYSWSGSGGYLNPTPGGQPERFATLIQIVLAPGVTPQD